MIATAVATQLLRESVEALAETGVDSPEFDARVLLACILEVELSQIPLLWQQPLTAQQERRFREYVQRRCAREPLQYITGETEFYGQRFHCDRHAMIPRPETELLVDTVAAYCQQSRSQAVIADIGTGSGVIAVSLALLLPRANIYATDAATDALQLAAENAQLHCVTGRIQFLLGSYLQPLEEAGVLEQAEVVVTNPPYIATEELESLQSEVRDFEPRQALDGGPEGLDFYYTFLPECRRLARLQLLAMEIGIGQAPAVTRLMSEHLATSDIKILPDLAGIARVVLVQFDR